MTTPPDADRTEMPFLEEVISAVSTASELYAVLAPGVDFSAVAPRMLDKSWILAHAPGLNQPSAWQEALIHPVVPVAWVSRTLPRLTELADTALLNEIDRVQTRIAAQIDPQTHPGASCGDLSAVALLERAARLQSVHLTPGSIKSIDSALPILSSAPVRAARRDFITASPELAVAAELAARQLSDQLADVHFQRILAAVEVYVASMWLWLLYAADVDTPARQMDELA